MYIYVDESGSHPQDYNSIMHTMDWILRHRYYCHQCPIAGVELGINICSQMYKSIHACDVSVRAPEMRAKLILVLRIKTNRKNNYNKMVAYAALKIERINIISTDHNLEETFTV